MTMKYQGIGLTALLYLAGSMIPAASQTMPQFSRIGSAAVVRGRVEARSSSDGSVGRILGSGKPVYLHDKISTDGNGFLQIILLDETVFTIGPNSSMVLDEFFYHPDNDSGKLSANLLEGVFRFITGKIARSKPGNMKVNTPVSTIGIFGTIVEVQVRGDGESEVLLVGPGWGNNAGEEGGHIQVYNQFGRTGVQRPGFGVRVRPGGSPSAPFKFDPSRTPEFDIFAAPSPNKSASAIVEKAQALLASGQDAASGAGSLAGPRATLAMSQSLNAVSQLAVQSATKDGLFPDGAVTSWEAIKALQGTFFFPRVVATFVGTLPCAGGVVNCSDTWHGQFTLDLTNKAIINSDTQFFTPNVNDIVLIGYPPPGPLSYQARSGPAILTIPTNNGFGTYTWRFINKNNMPAAQIVGTMIYNDGTNSGFGQQVINTR